MKLSLLDSAYHGTGNTEPVAIVYTVYRGEQRLTEKGVSLRYGKAKKPDRPAVALAIQPLPAMQGQLLEDWRFKELTSAKGTLDTGRGLKNSGTGVGPTSWA